MDLALNIRGDGSGADTAFRDVAGEAQSAAATIEQAFASMTKKTEAAFDRMEAETTASMKKMGDEGAAAWKKAEQAEAAQAAALKNVQAGFLAIGAAAVKFGVDSVHAFAEAEKIQLQLERAAGGLAEAFAQQADALESQLSIDAELIKQQQTLLIQWGASPAAVEPAIRAIEDYAAASGKDGVQATKDFLQAVENGDAKLKKFGVTYEQTGDKAKDFTALTQAMTSALGGAAQANANSLQGGLNAVDIAFGNVKEAFGGVIGAMEGKLGVLDKVANAMQRIARGIATGGGTSSWGGAGGGVLGSLANMDPIGMLQNALGLGGAGTEAPAAPDIAGGAVSRPVAIHLPGFDPSKRAQERAAAASEPTMDQLLSEETALTEEIARQTEEWNKNNAAVVGSMHGFETYVSNTKLMADAIKSAQPLYGEVEKAWEKSNKKAMEKSEEAMSRFLGDASKDNAEVMKRGAKEWSNAGAAIGNAFTGALQQQLAQLASGGEFDVAVFVGDILAATIAIAATVIGTAYGQPELGAAVGNLAAMGVRAGASAISADRKKSRSSAKKYHSGGVIGDEIDIPRYHSGGNIIGQDERLIIAQTGEHMVSRQGVANMGGHAAIEAAANGRAGSTIINNNIQALDAKNSAEGFMSSIGKGLKNALRTGQGDLPRILGVSPR